MPPRTGRTLLDRKLVAHPSSPCSNQDLGLSVSMNLESGGLEILYRLHGNHAEVCLPDQSENPQRKDELWKSTCMELFVKTSRKPDHYLELNFSPSGEWAFYRFNGYRTNRENPSVLTAPSIDTRKSSDSLEIFVHLPSDFPLELEGSETTALFSPCAVVLVREGQQMSYWAISHHQLQPDFHDPKPFVPLIL